MGGTARPVGAERACALAGALLTMLAACVDRVPPTPRSASRYLLVQAAGVEFGVTQEALAAARPNAAWTASGLVDRITSRDANAFVFGVFPPSGVATRCDTCRLSAVTMTSAFAAADTAAYRARVRAIRERWTALAGLPRDSIDDSLRVGPPLERAVPIRAVRWRVDADSVSLFLRYRPEIADRQGATRLVHATVYDERIASAGRQ